MRKHVVSNRLIESQTVNADHTSNALNVGQTDYASIHIEWSSGSSPNIDIEVQVQNHDDDSWRALDFGATPNISGASGEHEIILQQMPFKNLRLFFDRASGSAVVDATVTLKSVGA